MKIKKMFLVISGASILLPMLAFGVIYKTTTKDGEIIFSDKPLPGSSKYDLTQSQSITWSSEETEKAEDVFLNEKKAFNEPIDGVFTYRSFVITSPTEKEYIRNNDGQVRVKVKLDPMLRKSDRILVKLDGKFLVDKDNKKRKFTTESFRFKGVYRGEHSIQLQVVDAKGKVLKQSQSVPFFMYRNIVTKNKPFAK